MGSQAQSRAAREVSIIARTAFDFFANDVRYFVQERQRFLFQPHKQPLSALLQWNKKYILLFSNTKQLHGSRGETITQQPQSRYTYFRYLPLIPNSTFSPNGSCILRLQPNPSTCLSVDRSSFLFVATTKPVATWDTSKQLCGPQLR